MNRRDTVLALLALATAPVVSLAQQTGKVWRVGFLILRSRPISLDADYSGGFARGMRELGYVEGKNLLIERRFADGKVELLPALAAELVRLNVDVIVSAGTQPTGAAQNATSTIPIVMANTADPVGSGLVKSLARPGGNITGASNISVDLGAKHLEMLLAIVPALTQVAILVNPTNASSLAALKQIEAASKKKGIKITATKAQTAQEIESAFLAMSKERAGAVIVANDAFLNQQAHQIAQLAMKNRLPSINVWAEFPEGGGLMSYGPSHDLNYRRAAIYVDKIFKGAKPGDLPVEQPTELELIVNSKTAKALGLTVPREMLLRAHKVIEQTG
jgi:putative tryptophan/tyrosine transport system substrate-binding protein